MNIERINALHREYSQFLEEKHTLYLDSIVGFELIRWRLDDYQNQIINRSTQFGGEALNKELLLGCSVDYQDLTYQRFRPHLVNPTMTQRELLTRVSENGKNALVLGASIVVSAYAYWEEYLRLELAKALGILCEDAKNDKAAKQAVREHVTSDFWGDMSFLRHSIVHNNGVATNKIKKCKIITKFKPGEVLRMNFEIMSTIFDEMEAYREKMLLVHSQKPQGQSANSESRTKS